MKRLILSLCMLLALAAFKSSKENTVTITGKVTDQRTGAALPNTSIYAHIPLKSVGSADQHGKYKITVPSGTKELTFAATGYDLKKVKITGSHLDIALTSTKQRLTEAVIRGYQKRSKEKAAGGNFIVPGDASYDVPVANVEQLVQGKVAGLNIQNNTGAPGQRGSSSIRGISAMNGTGAAPQNDESYAATSENGFKNAMSHPRSTFSVDVDAASYSNLRRFINNGSLPPADAVRIEEMINYFDYDYAQPKGSDPVVIHTEISSAPWNTRHKLVKIGLQGRKIPVDNLPASNLVFLIDVSGSMNEHNKLPLLISSFKMLTEQLRASDKVAIVVYAGQAGMVLPSTPGDQKTKIKEALNQLSAGGSTAGGQGIELAYKIAAEHFIKGGNNRVILATDGDFNVGASSDQDMQKLIENKRKSGIFLTALGFGMGNYKDSKMETLANKGNGNYAYIDNISEARKTLINEFGGTLFTIAKDVKLQVEFNPAKVQAYRLVGYENRMLKARDFNDDQKDAGEMGSGHTVTALYEVIPVGIKSSFSDSVDELKYQTEKKSELTSSNSRELLTVKVRYKNPGTEVSKLITEPVIDTVVPFGKASENFRFSAAVAEFGMLLRQSPYQQNADFDQVIKNAQQAIGKDQEGYRSEFVKLARSAKLLAKDLLTLEQTNKFDEKN